MTILRITDRIANVYWSRPGFVVATTSIAGLALALAASGCGHRADPAGQPPGKSLTVPTCRIALTRFPDVVTVDGVVAPQYQAAIATRIQGRVDAVLVQEGDRVTRGQSLIELDSADLDAAVSEAAADLSAARSRLASAQAALAMEEADSPQRVRDAAARVAEADSALQAAQAERDRVFAGPRQQEREEAAQTVAQADSSLILARSTLERITRLYSVQAVSEQDFDQAKSACDTAEAQYQSALLQQSQSSEGSRSEDKRAASDAVDQARAELASARAGLAQARTGTLTVNLKRGDVAGAQSAVLQAQTALDMARANRSYATIAAPFDGIITQRLIDPGAMAGPGVPLLTIQGGALRLQANVPESALNAVRVGDKVGVSLVSAVGSWTQGTVVALSRQGDGTSHTFVAKIDLPEAAGARSGMYGSTEIRVRDESYLSAPSTAIVDRDGLTYVYVVGQDGIAHLRYVTIGTAQSGQTPLLSGCNRGDEIVASQADSVGDGDKIGGGDH
jgi:RND family efflux transporter MFP subunit